MEVTTLMTATVGDGTIVVVADEAAVMVITTEVIVEIVATVIATAIVIAVSSLLEYEY